MYTGFVGGNMEDKGSVYEMMKHNRKVVHALHTLIDLGHMPLIECFQPIIDAIANGTSTDDNVDDLVKRDHLYAQYYEYNTSQGFNFFDLQGSEWESFWELLNHAVEIELTKPIIRDSSKLVKYLFEVRGHNKKWKIDEWME
jgi:hypothetical protein